MNLISKNTLRKTLNALNELSKLQTQRNVQIYVFYLAAQF
jgi:hypothetical protein